MTKCKYCNGCMRHPYRESDLIYFVCKLCKKVYITKNHLGRLSIDEVTDEELISKLIKNVNMERID